MANWLTIKAAAELLEIPEQMLRELIAAGNGPRAFRKGPLVRLTQEDCEAWVIAQFDSQNPENSDGWEEVGAGNLPSVPVERFEAAARAASPDNLYGAEDPAGIGPSGPGIILGPDGRAVDAGQLRIGTRGDAVLQNDYGEPFEAPDPTAGIPPELLVGVDATPPHVVKACVEDSDTFRKLVKARLSHPAAR